METHHESVRLARQQSAHLAKIRGGRPAPPARDLEAQRQAADRAERAALPAVRVFAYAPSEGTPLTHLGAERVTDLQPAAGFDRMRGCPGFVGIDLGNTGSMPAYMPDQADDVAAIRLLRLDRLEDKASIPSAVRVTEYTPGGAEKIAGGATRTRLAAADCRIGADALDGLGPAGGALILGAKRLMSDPGTGPGHRVRLGNAGKFLPRHLPAELFLDRLVRAFHAAGGTARRWARWPATGPLAVTHPTTFSARGLENPHGPGYARGLRTLHPDGVNLLVYGCGGGTTDVALVRATAEGGAAAGEAASRLRVEVLGRTGRRGFGGDDITEAVFAVLKAPLAEVADFLARHADKLLPTRFDRGRLDVPEVRERADAVLDLWNQAERSKRELREADAAEPSVPLNGGRVGAYLEKAFRARAGGRAGEPPPAAADLAKALNGLTVTRAEVDAMIGERVRATVDRADGLIRRKLPARRPGTTPTSARRSTRCACWATPPCTRSSARRWPTGWTWPS